MVCVSSFRPFDKCTPAIAANQIRAHQSWIMAFERIIYVGKSCPELSSILSEFVPGEDRPSIQHLCKIAASVGTWAALVNSDIVISPKLKEVEARMNVQGLKCALSQRHDLDSGFVIDQGLDFFVGVPEVWKAAAEQIPRDFRISFGQWDSFMASFMVDQYGRKCVDITREKIVYHPKHEDRLGPNWEGPGLSHKYAKTFRWPSTILR